MKKNFAVAAFVAIAALAFGTVFAGHGDMVLPDLSVIQIGERQVYDRSLIWNNSDDEPSEVPVVISPEDEENEGMFPNGYVLGDPAASIGNNKPVAGPAVPNTDSLTGMIGPRSIVVASPRRNADREIDSLIRALN